MEHVIDVYLNDGDHSELHAANTEHEHSKPGYIKLIVSFDEDKLAGIMPLNANHVFLWQDSIRLVRRGAGKESYVIDKEIDSDGKAYNCPCKAQIDVIELPSIAKRRFEENKNPCVNLQDVVDEIVMRWPDWEKVKPIVAEAEEKRKARWDIQEAERKAIEEEKYKQRQAEEAAKKEAEAKAEELFKTKALAWAKEHGSERLRKGLEKGYRCKQVFIREFCEGLGGSWAFDWDKDISTKARSCPSLEALNLVEELENNEWLSEVSIVWLPQGYEEIEGAYDRDPEPTGFEAIEAQILGYYVYRKP